MRPDLSLDASFGDGGRRVLGSSGDDQAADILSVPLEGTGAETYFVSGQVSAGDRDFHDQGYQGKIDLAVLRLDERGQLSPDFRQDGIWLLGGSHDDEVIVHLRNYSEPGHRLVRSGQQLLLAAMTRSGDGDWRDLPTRGTPKGRDLIVLRFDLQGIPDHRFAHRGRGRWGSTPGTQPKQHSGHDFVFSIESAERDGFVLSGYTVGANLPLADHVAESRGNNPGQGADDAGGDIARYKMDGWVLRLDANGRLVSDWGDHGVRFIGGTRQEKMYAVSRTPDGGFLLAGRTTSHDLDFAREATTANAFDAFVVKLNARGDIDPAWGHHGRVLFSGTSDDQAKLCVNLADGRTAVLVESTSVDGAFAGAAPRASIQNRDAWIFLLDSRGAIEAAHRLGTPDDDRPTTLVELTGGRLLVGGASLKADGDHIFLQTLHLP